MNKKIIAMLCTLLVLLTAFSVFGIATSAGSASITYSFSGSHKNDKGFAEGKITLSADAGTYWLYWADNDAGLTGYDPIGSVVLSTSGSAAVTMPAYTAIPAKATKILAFKGTSKPTNLKASAAAAFYTIPASKAFGKTDADLLYSFAALSDFHMESNNATPYSGWSAKYPYDNEHLTAAFNTAAARGVDFIITTGDHINNQRNDNNGGNNNLYAEEWNNYLKILANSNFTGPVYEAIGNHELWNYETDSAKKPVTIGDGWKVGYNYFNAMTGLDSTAASVNSGKAYYEITEPVTGDHFLFMALEGGFYTDANNEFSDAQLTWLENKLKAYQNDGKNIFIMQHANFDKWGSGDQLNKPIYDLPLKDTNTATTKLKTILQTYKNAVMITGHTHFKFSLQLNYSDNNGTSATMVHNSSVGAVRDIKNGTTRINDATLQLSEGYIVEVYDDATIFYGTNLYYNSIIPTATYLVAQSTSAINQPTEPVTDPPTQPPTQPKTEPPTQASEPPLPTFPPKPTEPTEPATEPEPEIVWGDADGDGEVMILDATAIQRHLAAIKTLGADAIKRSMVTGGAELTILDATAIQRKLAGIIKYFDVETPAATGVRELAAVGADADLTDSSADLNTLRTQAKSALDKYWLLASYDQYQALKKAYKENADLNTLTAAYDVFNAAVKSFYPGDTIDVYFTAPSGWSSVNAYIYNNSSDQMAAWPGKACTKVSGSIWKINVPTGRYSYIIFNSGSSQTIDLALGATKNQAYRTSGQYNGKYKGYAYQYQ